MKKQINYDEMLMKGSLALAKRNFKRAFNLYKMAVDAGNIHGLHNLAYFYDEGIGVKKNHKIALQLYKKAYRNGDAGAAYNIAVNYLNEGNIDRSKFWFKNALSAGDFDAAVELAKFCFKGKRITNKREALHLINIAIKAKSSKSITPAGYEEAKALLKKLNQVVKK